MSGFRWISFLSASLRCGVAATSLVAAGAAFAQVTEPVRNPEDANPVVTPDEDSLDASTPSNAEAGDEENIIVTGTLVRGIAPVGTNVVGLSEGDVEATGIVSSAQLMEKIPQFNAFNTLQFPAGGGNTVTVNKPNLRGIPGFNTSGGSTTLVLIDGHRVVGMGVLSTTPDPDAVPPGSLERVEVIPDGGSAIYGSDAVAGVLNLITRKRFDGIGLDARYGFGDEYHTFDANGTVGRTWDTGSVYASYNYAENDAIFGRDRDYVREFPTFISGTSGPVSRSPECAPFGTVVGLTNGTRFALPFVAGTSTSPSFNDCDVTDAATIFPSQRRHAAIAGLNQDLTDDLSIDIRAFYMNRKIKSVTGPFRFTQLLTPISFLSGALGAPFTPFGATFGPPAGFGATGPNGAFLQNVSGAFGPDNADRQTISLETWSVVPTFTADIGGGWQLRGLGSYGESYNTSRDTGINSTALVNALPSGLFNPYNPTASNPTALAAITNFETFGRARQELVNGRLIADGELFALPGGGVKLAAGIEYIREAFQPQNGGIVPGTQNSGFAGLSVPNAAGVPVLIIPPRGRLSRPNIHRNVKSAFGELVVPIFGVDNATTGFHSLTFSASGRYDDYSDVGDTFNPKFGVTYKPVEWITLRGTWGESFNAPSLADDERSTPSTFSAFSGVLANFFQPNAATIAASNGVLPPVFQGQQVVSIGGNTPDIQPQEATTWSAGIDIQPPFVPGLNLSLTYYNLEFDNAILQPPFFSPQRLYTEFLPFVTLSPTNAQIAAAQASAAIVNSTPCVTAPNAAFPCAYALLDTRKRNLGKFKQDGLDFNASYNRETGFGSIDLGVAGSYILNRESSALPGSPLIDQLVFDNSRLSLSSTAGAQIGGLRAQATWNHRSGFDIQQVAFTGQDEVKAFNTFDLFFKYDIEGLGFADDLALTLNVRNVFDEDPPLFTQSNGTINRGFTNGGTVGRLVQVGVSTKF